MTPRRVYFDNNAATWIDPEVLHALRIENEQVYGNPSGLHRSSREARQQLDRARARIVEALQTEDHRVIFTSGATESNNLALSGSLKSAGSRQDGLMISSIEHPSVRAPALRLGQEGHPRSEAPVDETGSVDLDRLENLLDEERPALLSIIAVNNETGMIQPIDTIYSLCRDRGIILHTDAVQAPGRTPLDHIMQADLITLSSHKIHGPNGLGVLLVNKSVELSPMIIGGDQEGGMRAGTENTPATQAFAAALERATSEVHAHIEQFIELRRSFLDGLVSIDSSIVVNGDPARSIPNTLNLRFPGISAETMVLALDFDGIAVGTGSACSTGSTAASSVLLAMRRSRMEALESIRISFSTRNTLDEVGYVLSRLREIVTRHRSR